MPQFIRGPEILIIIFLIVIIIWGPKNLPRLARSFGQSIKQFRLGIKEANEDIEPETDNDGKAGEEPEKT